MYHVNQERLVDQQLVQLEDEKTSKVNDGDHHNKMESSLSVENYALKEWCICTGQFLSVTLEKR